MSPAFLDVAIALAVAAVAWKAVDIAMNRAAVPDKAGRAIALMRIKTLLPLIRRGIHVAIIVVLAVTVMSAVGVDIGPLLAGLGIAGLALGFGAQTLVRDIVAGVFYLIDDAFRLGEYVEIGQAKGTVEAINLRSLVLRHQRGSLYTVPFGEVKVLNNRSRDWVIDKLLFPVALDTDLAKVKKVFRRIGQDLQADPELGPSLLEPVKSQGVFAIEDSALIVRAKFKSLPGQQFLIRREVFERAQKAFEREGIRFARRGLLMARPCQDSSGPAGDRTDGDTNRSRPG
ncbi:MAG TPA: mechanosensitive ion channel family protein [Alphaproteobacteria bacterium]|nr:mechanosensitive ion channel family protein [Alphaproteobacteria bacterium]